MEEKTYIGFSYGSFLDDRGVNREYCSVFMIEDFSGDQSETRHYGGQKAVKYKCDSPKVFEGIAPGSQVKCYFSSSGKLAYMQIIGGNKQSAGKD